MKKTLPIIFLFFSIASFAQDPAFSQMKSAPLLVNPAFAGSWASGRASTSYRLQWPNLSGCYQTVNVSYDQYFKCGGVGFNYMHDDQARGIYKTDRFDLDYSPYLSLFKDTTGKGKLIVQFGIDVSYYQKKLDYTRLNFGDMIDPRRGFVYNSTEVPSLSAVQNLDFSTGVLIYSKRFAGGFAAYHLTEPNEAFYGVSKLPIRFVIHGSGIIGKLDEAEKQVRVIPSFIYMKQQDFQNLITSLNVVYDKFSLGIGYRWDDALIFSAGYNHGYVFGGYSYDLTTSKLAGATGGTHELFLGMRFANKKWSSRRTNLQLFN